MSLHQAEFGHAGRSPWSVSGKFPVCYVVMSYSVRLDTHDLPILSLPQVQSLDLELSFGKQFQKYLLWRIVHVSPPMPTVTAPEKVTLFYHFQPSHIFSIIGSAVPEIWAYVHAMSFMGMAVSARMLQQVKVTNEQNDGHGTEILYSVI